MPKPDTNQESTKPLLTVVIPVHNGVRYLTACLEALKQSTIPYECVVVDDGSTDDPAAVALVFGACIVRLDSQHGPAHARNIGAAKARSELILFVDADVAVAPDSLERVLTAFVADSELDALLGSYDDLPLETDFVSQYKNLMHHFVHQSSKRDACTFWSGFGAIRKKVFWNHGGFDTSYGRPAIEDIELGYRLHKAGCKIVLDSSIQVKHLKQWSFLSLIRTDMIDRALPWTQLILRDSVFPNDLNLSISQRISVALAFVFVSIAIAASFYSAVLFLPPLIGLLFLLLSHYETEVTPRCNPRGVAGTISLIAALAVTSYWAQKPVIFVCSLLAYLLLLWQKHYYSPDFRGRKWIPAFTGIYLAGTAIFVAQQMPGHYLTLALFLVFALLIILNARFYTLLASKRGPIFAIGAFPFQLLFHLYSGLAFLIGLTMHFWRKRRAAGLLRKSQHDSLL